MTHRSIYRDVDNVYQFQSETLVWASRRREPARRFKDPVEEEDERRLRRPAEPANFPLPQTRAWAMRLPAEVRPVALLRDFGRIANLLAMAWPDSAATYRYLHELLIDHRGNRAGFAPEIHREIEDLYRYYVEGWQSRTQVHDARSAALR